MGAMVVSIICIALMVLGGMMMSQGILTSADSTALSVEKISAREGEITRTAVASQRAAHLSWADLLRVTVENTGQTKLATFDKWDLIVRYYDSGGVYHTEWLPCTTGTLTDNKWQKARIGLNGPAEYFEPDILNAEEELVILAKLNPLPGDNTTGDVTIVTPNGIYDSIDFSNPGYTLLTPHSENTTIAGTHYYELVEATQADGAAATFRAEFAKDVGGRKLLENESQPSRLAKHVFPLVGISKIPEATWTVYYRCFTWGDGEFPQEDEDVRFNIDILVRQADGTLRATIATNVAEAYIDKDEEGIWLTKSATYNFTEYTVIDDSDYLEIDYYGATDLGPNSDLGYMQLLIDDDTLDATEQTRIKA
jgi:hypothetical protein